ncbi:hypothetical protein PV328_012040, partial [Microctonus aethiopoides]
EHLDGPLLNYFFGQEFVQYKKIQTNGLYLNCCNFHDSMVMLEDKNIYQVQNIVKVLPNQIYFIIRRFKIIDIVYENPCSSAMLFMFVIVEDKHHALTTCLKSDIAYKMWTIPHSRREYFAIELCHTLHEQNHIIVE